MKLDCEVVGEMDGVEHLVALALRVSAPDADMLVEVVNVVEIVCPDGDAQPELVAESANGAVAEELILFCTDALASEEAADEGVMVMVAEALEHTEVDDTGLAVAELDALRKESVAEKERTEPVAQGLDGAEILADPVTVACAEALALLMGDCEVVMEILCE